MIRGKNKRGELLVENIVFIVLNLLFLSILVVFLLNQSSAGGLYEDAYSKNIALLIDSSKPGTIMKINMKKALEISEKKGVSFKDVVKIDNRVVHVNIVGKKGREYDFFNNYSAVAYPDVNEKGEYNGLYVITVNSKNENETE